MVIYWHGTKNDTNSENLLLSYPANGVPQTTDNTGLIPKDQLNLIILCVGNNICKFWEFCANIKKTLEYDPSPRPPQEFNPLRTIRKYE